MGAVVPRASLFEIETVVEDPANLNSADAEYVVTASDSMDYVVKTVKRHALLPASEWLCHRLAEACGIPTPQFGIIRLRNGDSGFGSQWDASVVTNQDIINSVLTVIPGPPLLAKIFSQIYALDLFVHNEDRHIGNYLFVRTRSNVGVKVYDFSRGLLRYGVPLPALPMKSDSNTIKYGRALRVAYPMVVPAVQEVVRRLLSISDSVVASWIDEMPSQWIPVDLRRLFLKWWEKESGNRAALVEKGIADGSLL